MGFLTISGGLPDIRSMIRVHSFTFSPITENTYLLMADNGDTAIVDPGCYTQAERNTLSNFIRENQLKPVYCLQTHCHLDHVFGTRWVAETWGLQPYLHRAEEKLLHFAPASGQLWGLPFDGYEGACHWLNGGDTLSLGKGLLEVLFTPGHSPGHVCFYNRKEGYVIGGDVLFAGSIGRTDLPGGDYDTLIESIRLQLLTLPDDTVVYPGHGPATTIGQERGSNPFLRE